MISEILNYINSCRHTLLQPLKPLIISDYATPLIDYLSFISQIIAIAYMIISAFDYCIIFTLHYLLLLLLTLYYFYFHIITLFIYYIAIWYWLFAAISFHWHYWLLLITPLIFTLSLFIYWYCHYDTYCLLRLLRHSLIHYCYWYYYRHYFRWCHFIHYWLLIDIVFSLLHCHTLILFHYYWHCWPPFQAGHWHIFAFIFHITLFHITYQPSIISPYSLLPLLMAAFSLFH